MKITLDTTMIKLEPEDDARLLIEEKKRKRCVEENSPKAELDEERNFHAPSPVLAVVSQTKVISRKRDTNLAAPLHKCTRCGSSDHVTRYCNIPLEDLYCSFCKTTGHVIQVCFRMEKAKNQKRAKHQQPTEYVPRQTCNYCGLPDHDFRECKNNRNLYCSFCKKTGHVESVCSKAKNQYREKCEQQIEPAPLQNRVKYEQQEMEFAPLENRVPYEKQIVYAPLQKRAKYDQETENAPPLQRCTRCGSLNRVREKCDIPFQDVHCVYCNRAGHVESVCGQARSERAKIQKQKKHTAPQRVAALGSVQDKERKREERAKNHQQTESTAPQREAALGPVQDKERTRECMRKNNTEGDKSEIVAKAPSWRADYRKLKAESDEFKRDTDSQISALTCTNARLQSELDDLKRETAAKLSSLNSTNVRLGSKFDVLKRETDAKLSSLESTNARLCSELAEAEARIAMYVKVPSQLEYDDLETRFDDLRVKYSNLLKEKELEIKKQGAKIKLLDQSPLQYVEDERKIKELLKLTVELGEQKEKADAQIQSMTSENTSLQNDLHDSRRIIRHMEAEERNNAAELSEVKQKAYGQIQSLTSERTILRNKIVAAQERVSSMQAEKQKLAAEQVEEKQKADAQIQSLTSEKSSLQNELDAARIAVQAEKSECDNKLAILLSEKEIVEGDRDAAMVALDNQKAQATKLDTELALAITTKENLEKKLDGVELARGDGKLGLERQKALAEKERREKLKMHKSLTNLEFEHKKLKLDLNLAQDEAAKDKKKLAQAWNELDKARADIVDLNMELEVQVEERIRLEKLNHEVIRLREEAVANERKLVQTHKNERKFVQTYKSEHAEMHRAQKFNHRAGKGVDYEDPNSSFVRPNRYFPKNSKNGRS